LIDTSVRPNRTVRPNLRAIFSKTGSAEPHRTSKIRIFSKILSFWRTFVWCEQNWVTFLLHEQNYVTFLLQKESWKSFLLTWKFPYFEVSISLLESKYELLQIKCEKYSFILLQQSAGGSAEPSTEPSVKYTEPVRFGRTTIMSDRSFTNWYEKGLH